MHRAGDHPFALGFCHAAAGAMRYKRRGAVNRSEADADMELAENVFFYLSKIAFFFMRPSNFILLVLGAGFFCLLASRLRKTGLFLTGAGVFLYALVGLSPFGNMITIPLEDRFPAPVTLPDEVSAIIVLGGALDTTIASSRPYPGITMAAERLTVVPELARRYPQAKVVHSGGEGLLFASATTEAVAAERVFEGFGIDPERIVMEDRSRNTWQNAVETRALLSPQPGEKFLLVTSAYHMPRAMGVFRQAGWEGVIAYPVDWRTRGPQDMWRPFGSSSEGFLRVDIAVKEWVGLAVYWMSGRSSSLFPSPDDQ